MTTPRKARDFLVYDLEWVPGLMQVRLCGVYDGNRYRGYRTVEDFLNNELTSKNRGKWFYAHAGGLADIQFVFQVLLKWRGYSVKASFSGSSAIIVHITRGKNSWHFIDSYWLLRDKLSEIGKSIGMPKGGPECGDCKQTLGENDQCARCLHCEEEMKEWYASVPLHILIPYNEQDCRILWHAIDRFQRALWDFGGQLQMTIASSAMHLFRRRYLTEPIPTNDKINEIAMESYTASRVEVLFKDWVDDANYFDINSSFPYAMTFPAPGACIGSSNEIPSNPETLFLVDCDIEVPECFLPPIPARVDKRIYFPTGKWRAWLTDVDFNLLQREGGKVHKIYEVKLFEPFHDLAEYSTDIYAKRKASTDPFERVILKLLLNSLYGKFAESEEKTSLHIDPPAWIVSELRNAKVDPLFPGVWLAPEMVEVKHRHPVISSRITSLGRKHLYEFLVMSDDAHYCDTDGFSAMEMYPTSKNLGGLKHEKRRLHALYVKPKLYMQEGETLDPITGEWKQETLVKAKGFSLGRDKARALELFNELIDEGEIRVNRMVRIRENLRRAVTDPANATNPIEKEIIKRLRQDSIEKRHVYPDGRTRPLTVEELQENVGVVGKK